MANFSVVGPFEVETEAGVKGQKFVNAETGRKFWKVHPDLEFDKGCYVFAFRAAKGWKPFYVGKATKGFGQEAFTHHKLTKITEAIANRVKGTLVIFLVKLELSKGKVNQSAIDEVETYLIQAGLVANSDLLNDKKTRVEGWAIDGIVRSKKGKPTNAASNFRKCMKLG